MRRLATAAVLAVAVLVAFGLPGLGASDPSGPASPPSFSSERHSFEGILPSGWQRSDARLVPLISPREILTVGTAPMPAGGGGNCGREPVAAIRRMRSGDALISIQEYSVTPKMRSRVDGGYGPPTIRQALPDLELRRQAIPIAARSSPGGKLWSSTLWFRDAGRWLDALVYLRGERSPARLREARSILRDLRFG